MFVSLRTSRKATIRTARIWPFKLSQMKKRERESAVNRRGKWEACNCKEEKEREIFAPDLERFENRESH